MKTFGLSNAATALSRYEHDGFLCPLDFLNNTEVDHFRAQFDALEFNEGKDKSVINLIGRHTDQEFVWQLATDTRVLDWIETLIGPNILMLSTHFFCKYPSPSDGHFVAWHQDVAYWGLEPMDAITAWIAIDDSNVDNGCMEVIAGTHRKNLMPHATSDQPNNLLASNQAIDTALLDVSAAQPFELKAGQMSIHHGLLAHASRPNQSAHRRCGLTARFIAPHIKQVKQNNTAGNWKPILVRGTDDMKHFAPQPLPFALPSPDYS